MGQLVEFSPTPQMFTTPSDPRTEAYIPLRRTRALDEFFASQIFARLMPREVVHGTPLRTGFEQLKERLLWMGQPPSAPLHQAVHSVLDSE